MGVSIVEGSKMQSLLDLLQAQNHLISHQNAAIDLLASDKRAQLATDIGSIVELIRGEELLEVMDYGDQISPAWSYGGTNYAPPMNLCHLETAELEDGEQIPVADFEWHYTTPVGIAFDNPEALWEGAAALAAGTYNIKIVNDSWGGNNDKYIQFTTTAEVPANGQLRKTWSYNALATTGKIQGFASADSTTPLFTVDVTEGQGGTYLGQTDGSGDVNHYHRANLGYGRWKFSDLRQWLNSTEAAGYWWSKQNKWDVIPSTAATVDGFLHGYSADVIEHFKATKIQTVAANADNNVVDVTYDKVFLTSLEQMYCVPQKSGEGSYWEYYKRLLGRTTPAPTGATYARLIKYALNGTTSAQYCWRRSSLVSNLSYAWIVFASGYVYSNGAYTAYRCAPCVRIG